MPVPKHMQDRADSVIEPLEEVDLSDDPNVKKPISINAYVSLEERGHLIALLKQNIDLFAWGYHEMPKLYPTLVCHTLNTQPKVRPNKQARPNFHSKLEALIKLEVEKLIKARFIKTN